MNPAVMSLANRSFRFHLYDFNLSGVSVAELAAAYSRPNAWVDEQIESVRLCLKHQVRLSFKLDPEPNLIRLAA
jgi:hypothetical protein